MSTDRPAEDAGLQAHLVWLVDESIRLRTATYESLINSRFPDPHRSPAEFEARVRPAVRRGLMLWLERLATTLTGAGGLDEADAVHWLAVATGSPQPYGDQVRILASSINQMARAWWTAAPARLAAFAWAAGLTAAETQQRYEAGTLDAAGLQTLATLRGYRLPGGLERKAERADDGMVR